MVAYNFQPDFGPPILRGAKQSTMRPAGKRAHAVAGQDVQLFIGSRTKSVMRLLTAPCIGGGPIEVHYTGFFEDGVFVSDTAACNDLARDEGFGGFSDLQAWFDRRYGLPVTGLTRIRWSFADASFRTAWPAEWGAE